jgi:hypothetical protein
LQGLSRACSSIVGSMGVRRSYRENVALARSEMRLDGIRAHAAVAVIMSLGAVARILVLVVDICLHSRYRR